MTARQRCAGALVFDERGRLLLVRRGHEPSLGLWCEPSGRCEPGETDAEAAVRECEEETGLRVRIVGEAGTTLLDGHEAGSAGYTITDFFCSVESGTLRAGDDAAEVRWVDAAELACLPLAPGVHASLTDWGALPR